MRHPQCDEQHDLFPADMMPAVCARREPPAALPALPFERNREVDMERACRILDASDNTVRRMVQSGLLRAYKIKGAHGFGGAIWRIEHASIVEHCDGLRRTYHLIERSRSSLRPRDSDILPFPASETMTLEEVRTHLDVSLTTALKLLDSGEITGYKLMDATRTPWRIWRPSFIAYLNELRRQAAARTPNAVAPPAPILTP